MSGETSRYVERLAVAVAAVLLLALAFVSPAMAERRTALVIGNSTYADTPLPNTLNDARAISSALAAVGFEVTTLLDADQRAMHRAIIRFGRELEQGGVGLFYYAGHAAQVRQKNFMIPIGVQITVEDHVEPESVDLNKVMGRMAGARNRMNIVILDACRNNPFREMFRFYSEGLAQTPAPARSYVAYAAAPGALAVDGTGDNSFYTGALVKVLKQPGLAIEDVFKRVRSEVIGATNGFQVPWSSSSITEDFYFVPEEKKNSPQLVTRGGSPNPIDREVVFWQSIFESDNPVYFQAFLTQFPDGLFAQPARARFENLSAGDGSKHGPVGRQVETAESAKQTGSDWLVVIDEALTKSAKKENVDYVEQIHDAVMAFKGRLREWTQERQKAEETRRKAIEQAQREAQKEYENTFAAARSESEAAERRIVTEARAAAAMNFRNAAAEAGKKGKAAAGKVVADARRKADADLKAAISSANAGAITTHRKAVAEAEARALEAHRAMMAKAEETVERVRQRILSRAKAKADKALQNAIAESTQKADKAKQRRLVAARKAAERRQVEQIALAQEKAKKIESEWVAAAERKAGAKRTAMLARAGEKAKAERDRLLADGRIKAEQARERRLANVAGPEAFPENGSANELKQETTGAKDKPAAGGLAATGQGEASELQRVIDDAREKARRRGADVTGQARAVIEAVKKYKEGKRADAAVAVPPGFGMTELDPKLKSVLEKAMSNAYAKGVDYSGQVRAALNAVKAYRRRESETVPANASQEPAVMPAMLRKEILKDPKLKSVIDQAMERARTEGKGYTAQVRSALSAIKAYKRKGIKPAGQ